jgi:hypothetical protein
VIRFEPVFGVGADVVDDEAVQPVRMVGGVGHRDDAAHRRADEDEPAQSQPVDKRRQIAGLVGVLVGARRRPGALAMAAHIHRDHMEAPGQMPRQCVERLGARGIAVHAHDRRRLGPAPIEIVQSQTVDGRLPARRLQRLGHRACPPLICLPAAILPKRRAAAIIFEEFLRARASR